VKCELQEWLNAAVIDRGKLFRLVNKAGKTWGDGMTEKSVWHIVKESAKAIGLDKLAPHDLRRTCARLCHASGGELVEAPSHEEQGRPTAKLLSRGGRLKKVKFRNRKRGLDEDRYVLSLLLRQPRHDENGNPLKQLEIDEIRALSPAQRRKMRLKLAGDMSREDFLAFRVKPDFKGGK